MSRLGDTPVCFSPPRFVLEATRVRWNRWPWMEQPPGQVSGPEARRGARHVRGRRSAGGRRQSLCSCRTVKADVTLQKATYSGGHKVKSRQSQEGDGSEKRNKQEGSGHDTRPQGQEQEAEAGAPSSLRAAPAHLHTWEWPFQTRTVRNLLVFKHCQKSSFF